MKRESPQSNPEHTGQVNSDGRHTIPVDLFGSRTQPGVIEPQPPYAHDPAGIRVVIHYIGIGFLMCIGGIILQPEPTDKTVIIALGSIASACIAGFGYFYGTRRRDNKTADSKADNQDPNSR